MLERTGLLALAAALALIGPLTADEIRGIIVRVDLKRNEVQIEGRGPGQRGLAMTFALGEDTRVLFGRDAGGLQDLAPGKRVRVVFGAGQLALSLHLFGFRPRLPAPDSNATMPRAGAGTVTGVLQRVSYVEREVVVIGPGAQGPETETIIAIPKEVRVTQDGEVIPYDELKDGREAVIQTERKGRVLVAHSIQVGSPVPESASANGRFRRIRRLLKVADRLLELAAGMPGDRPDPEMPKEPAPGRPVPPSPKR